MSNNRQSDSPKMSLVGPQGFTLLEMVVVIVIILTISILLLPTVFASLNDRKFSDATRTFQAVFLGARDRAIHSGNIVGVRLVRDELDPWNVTSLQYVGTIEPYATGTVRTTGYTVEPERKYTPSAVDPHWEQVNPGKNGALHDFDDIPRVDALWYTALTPNGPPGQVRTQRSFVRFNFTGRLYHIYRVDVTTPLSELILDNAGPMPPAMGIGTQYQIFGPPILIPQTEGILLPEGMVIDVRTAPIVAGHPFASDPLINIPRSRWIPNQVPPVAMVTAPPATWPRMDILFGPNGQVIGDAASQSLIHFWIAERGDKGPDPARSRGMDNTAHTSDDVGPNRPHLLVTLNTRTGTMEVQHNPGTASVDNWPPMVASDDYADIYAPAEQTLGISSLP